MNNQSKTTPAGTIDNATNKKNCVKLCSHSKHALYVISFEYPIYNKINVLQARKVGKF